MDDVLVAERLERGTARFRSCLVDHPLARLQVPQRRIEGAEDSLAKSVASAPQHHQVGMLDAAPAVTLASKVQPVLREYHAGRVPRPAAGVLRICDAFVQKEKPRRRAGVIVLTTEGAQFALRLLSRSTPLISTVPMPLPTA